MNPAEASVRTETSNSGPADERKQREGPRRAVGQGELNASVAIGHEADTSSISTKRRDGTTRKEKREERKKGRERERVGE